MKNLRVAIQFATSTVRQVCNLEVLFGDYSPVDPDLADCWVSQTGEPLHEGFVDWMLKHPECGREYHLLAVLRHGGKALFVVDIAEDMAEIYNNLFRYEEERKKFTAVDFAEVPQLSRMEILWEDGELGSLLPYEWEEFWDAYN